MGRHKRHYTARQEQLLRELAQAIPWIQLRWPVLTEELSVMQQQVQGHGIENPLVSEAKARLMIERWDGVDCPTCERRAQVYNRRINREIAGCLGQLMLLSGPDREWVSAKQFKRRGGEYSKLIYWALAEFENHRSDSTRSSGPMRPTDLGADFWNGLVKVQGVARVYNNEVLKLEGEMMSIRDVKKFDLDEVLGRTDSDGNANDDDDEDDE